MTVGISIAPRIIERVMRAKVAVVTELDPKIWIDFMNCSDISDEKPPNCLDLLNESMYEVAGQIGAMEPEDPKFVALVDELYLLGGIHASLKSVKNKFNLLQIERLVRDIALLKPGDPRRIELISSARRLTAEPIC